jgi:hypothetical protein
VTYPPCIFCGTEVSRQSIKYCSNVCQRNYEHAINVRGVLETGSFDGFLQTDRTRKKVLITIRGHRCEICGLELWRNQPVPLVFDHVNGDSSDNSLSNTRLVCGNCDMQLPTYKNKNSGNGRASRRKRYADGKSY